MSARYLRVDDGTTWPAPNHADEHDRTIGWRLTYDPDSLAREDFAYLASIASAYSRLVQTPLAAKQLPAVRRAVKQDLIHPDRKETHDERG